MGVPAGLCGGRIQFTAVEALNSKNLISAGVNVEWMIGYMKRHKILKNRIDMCEFRHISPKFSASLRTSKLVLT